MINLTILYPKSEGSHFDLAYYLQKHIPLAQARLTPFGLVQVDMEEGVAGGVPDTAAAYRMIISLRFHSLEELQKALAIHGEELIGDIPNFTNVEPLMQISQVVVPFALMAS